MPKKTPQEIDQGMRDALTKEKVKEVKPEDLKLIGVQKGSMTMNLAEKIAERKKLMDSIK